MLEIWWLRHGSTDWNKEKRWQGHSDVPLNELGRSQARALAAQFKGIHFDGVWSSDLSRSMDTARLSLPEGTIIHPDPRLREIPMGIVEGRTWQELSPQEQAQIDAWWANPYDTYFPGSEESLGDVVRRVRSWQSELPQEGRVLAFSHGGTIRTMLWEIVGAPTSARPWSAELGNTGIMRVRYVGQSPTLLSFNDMSHLPGSWDLPPAQNVPGSH